MNFGKLTGRIAGIFTLVFCVTAVSNAENLMVLKIGPVWPRVLLNSEKPTAWDASFQSGALFDNIVAFGGGVDFLWNRNEKGIKIDENTFQLETKEKTLMFPITAFISITPVPDLIVQPVISGQIGLNTMYFSHEEKDPPIADLEPDLHNENGWYMGLIWKLALDASVRLGERTSVFAGFEYQWSKPKKLDEARDDIYTIRNMSGVGIRMGLRIF